MRILLAGLLAFVPCAALAQPANTMREAAQQVLAVLPAPLRTQAQRAFDDPDRFDWHYTPRSRNGVSFKELDAKGRDAVHALLKGALSATGYRKIVNIIELEIVLRELATFGFMRDPERYHLTIYGVPHPRNPWGWRVEGHHLSLNFTLAGDKLAVDTPSFLGANPAEVRSGSRKGLRVLGVEEDAARALLDSLSDAQRRAAVFSERTYGDIVTRSEEQVEPLEAVGVPATRLDASQRELLMRLIGIYARTFEAGLGEARMARVRKGGVEAIRFGWAGSTQRGRPHYYRIQGPQFLIEYDASQNDGNHIHTVWRDFKGDFGRDLFREHYSWARHAPHHRH
jgi:hypothetical protein